MFDKIKQRALDEKIQIIEIKKDGTILNSENNLFKLKKGSSLFDAHPIFESIQYYFNEDSGSEFTVSCINLNIGKISGIYDLTILVSDDKVLLTVFDFTAHYRISNTLSQEKNESIIQTQLLRERETFKNKFLANTSHELRTPLTAINGFTTVLKNSDISQEQLYYLDIIKTACDQLKNLIDDILDISKIEMGRLKIQNNRFDVIKLITLLSDAYTIRGKQKGITFSHSIDTKIPRFIIGDKYRLSQILTNLLNNALKFTSQGEVALKVTLNKRKGKHLNIEFSVSDTGEGIPEDKQKLIFESFTQLNDNDSKGGTGLGLSIVKSLARLMHGEVSVASTEGKGTTFTVVLDFEMSANQKIEDAPKFKQNPKNRDKKYNILIADDLEINQLLLMKIFAGHGSYYIDFVNNGDQVIERLHQTEYDLILMDLRMPKMDGYDTTNYIRQSGLDHFKNIPIIALTAKVSLEERDRCLTLGMNDYLGKPFEEKELLSKINNLL